MIGLFSGVSGIVSCVLATFRVNGTNCRGPLASGTLLRVVELVPLTTAISSCPTSFEAGLTFCRIDLAFSMTTLPHVGVVAGVAPGILVNISGAVRFLPLRLRLLWLEGLLRVGKAPGRR
uniref:Putative secreted protein n=1 Tax=Ixodes ricinus TaxID=34613 RepID=A0A6B0UML1_IXORI